MNKSKIFGAIAAIFLIFHAGQVRAERAYDWTRYVAGPVPADVLEVIDGDTLAVDAHPWPSQTVTTRIRLIGVDAPEIHGHCESEISAALAAKEALRELAGQHVFLSEIHPDKYAGRMDARVTTPAGIDISLQLIEDGHGRPYDGGRRQGWCQEQQPEARP